jgi:hypothetical protein
MAALPAAAADNVTVCRLSDIYGKRAVAKVRVLQVDTNPENLAELEAGVIAGHTVDGWQMHKDSRPGDLVIWYAAGRQQYIALGWVDDIPEEVTEGPGRYRGPVCRMEWIEPVDRKKVKDECRVDGGVESIQLVADEYVVGFLESLGLSRLTPGLRLSQLCPGCHERLPLTGICDNCA